MKSFVFLLLLLVMFPDVQAQERVLTISTESDLKTDLEKVPCKGRNERLAAVKQLFIDKGAAESEIKIEKLRDTENLVVTKTGKSSETVVIGAHYDKADTGCGALDNWTGIVVLANIYRTMRPTITAKTYVFVAFDKEELGLLGSEEMARSIPKESRSNYCAMVNFDSFGFSYPQALRNISSPLLIDLAAEVSNDLKIPFAKAGIDFASSDSESFKKRGIPAISLHGLSDNWTQFLHTPQDKIEKVNLKSLYLGYRHGLIFVSRVDEKPCDAFRKEKKAEK